MSGHVSVFSQTSSVQVPTPACSDEGYLSVTMHQGAPVCNAKPNLIMKKGILECDAYESSEKIFVYHTLLEVENFHELFGWLLLLSFPHLCSSG